MTGQHRSVERMAPPPKSQVFTVIVVSDHSQAVRKFRVTRPWLSRAAYIGGGVALGVLLLVGHYVSLLRTSSDNGLLREENDQLRSQILLVQEKVAHISSTLERVEQFDAKLRTAVTQLQDPERNLAIGPVGSGATGSAVADPAAPVAEGHLAALPGKLGSLETEASRQEEMLRQLQGYFDDQRSLLATTPSIWPARGWVTSDFGTRMDPYTAERKMHEGLDIATPQGQPIYSPSDGTVVFAGVEGGYGKVLVIDHGYGVKTRYGHVSEIFVRAGDRVRRGDKVAAVGNTGRSTGPHLHYEVRVNGLPENPRKFILE
jgi:murein DD-endopeptidase MepM/ murein hydrolase activator NlpD